MASIKFQNSFLDDRHSRTGNKIVTNLDSERPDWGYIMKSESLSNVQSSFSCMTQSEKGGTFQSQKSLQSSHFAPETVLCIPDFQGVCRYGLCGSTVKHMLHVKMVSSPSPDVSS